MKSHLPLGDIEDILSAWKNPAKGKTRNPAVLPADQDACRKMFAVTHPGFNMWDGVGRHPNSYFAASMYYKDAKEKGTLQSASSRMDEEPKPVTHMANLTEEPQPQS